MPPKTFYPEDKIAIIFSFIIIPLQVYFFSLTDSISTILCFILLILLILLQKKFNNKILKFFRSYIHIPYYGLIFTSFQSFLHKLRPADYDWLLLKADYFIFGTDFTIWFEQYFSKPLTEILTLSYFSYYVLPTLTFTLLFMMKNDKSFIAARNYLLSIVIGWYAAFIFYVLIPAAGPDMAYPENYSVVLTGLSPVTNAYLQNLSQYLKTSMVRNTFPSMHFAIILITNYFAFLHRRKYFWFCTLPLGILLGIATIYLRQHYLIDLVGSFPIAIFSIYIALKINKRITELSA